MKTHEQALFEDAPVWRAVTSLVVPTVISQVISVIYNMADTFFIGQIGDRNQVAAASLCLPMFIFITGASPNKPPNFTQSPAFLLGTGITLTAVVFLLIIPIAISSAIMPAIVVIGVSPGIAIISSPTEQTLVIASSLSMVKTPFFAASIMPASSETGIKAPDKPPT